MENARFDYKEGRDGQWYWHLRAAGATVENEIIATGEGYTSQAAAEGGVEAVKRGVLSACGIEVRERIILGETRIVGELEVESDEVRHYVRVDADAELPL